MLDDGDGDPLLWEGESLLPDGDPLLSDGESLLADNDWLLPDESLLLAKESLLSDGLDVEGDELNRDELGEELLELSDEDPDSALDDWLLSGSLLDERSELLDMLGEDDESLLRLEEELD